MSFLLACAYAIACGWLIWRAVSGGKAIDMQLGVMAVFAFGYFPLPVLLKPLTNLAGVEDGKLFAALAMHAVFLACLIVGAFAFRRPAEGVRPLRLGWLDEVALRYRAALCAGAFALHLGYVATTPQTSYDSENFESFFEENSSVRSLLAAVSGFSLSFVAMCCATAALWRRRAMMIVCGAIIMSAVLLALPLGQRLAALSPLVLLVAAFAATRQPRRALRWLGASVLVLLVLSPFAVYMRETRRANNGDFLSASEVTAGYRISDSPLAQGVASLLERSDIVYNTIYMKDYIDNQGYVGWPYYYSVLVSPLPRLVYADKPYVLSANGRIDGEISVLAWKEMIGGLGSLTAFGGLTAYREGGWVGIVLDGLADGAFFTFIARWLGDGGWLARMFYANFFLAFAVQKAPPCFMEALAAFLGMSPLLGAAYALSRAPDLLRVQLPGAIFGRAAQAAGRIGRESGPSQTRQRDFGRPRDQSLAGRPKFPSDEPPLSRGFRLGLAVSLPLDAAGSASLARRCAARLRGGSGWSANIYASAAIWSPANLTVGEFACIGPGAIVDSMAPIVLERRALVSQRAHLCAGGHDVDDPHFQLETAPIRICERAWVAAEAYVGAGVTVGAGAVLGARGCAASDLEPWTIYVGNPARAIRRRQVTVDVLRPDADGPCEGT